MKLHNKIFAGSLLLMTSGMATAHPGQHGESILSGFMHSFSNGDFMLGLLLTGIIISYVWHLSD